MNDTEKALEYYKCGIRATPPLFIPKRVLVMSTVRGDGPFRSARVLPGEYECQSNKYGAVSVRASNGCLLGLKPVEFEVIEWANNPLLDPQDLRTNL